jgi:cell division protein FtsB
MFDFHQKRRMRTVFASRVTQGVLLLLAFFILISAYNRYQIAKEMADRREAVESEISALESRRETMEAEVKYLSNERGIEAEMRRQFDIAREGEQVVIILEDETIEAEPATTTATTKRAWYKFW